MRVKTVLTTLATNTAGQVVESIPVLPTEARYQDGAGQWRDPIHMVEDPLGAPIRIVSDAVVLNSAGKPVAAARGEGVGAWATTEAALKTLYAANIGVGTPHSQAAMASPPTITVSGGSAGAPSAPYTALTQLFRYSLGATVFGYLCGGDAVFSSIYRRLPVTTRPSGGNATTTEDARVFRVAVRADAAAVAFRLLGIGTGNPYRFIVDGKYVDKTGTLDIGGGRNYDTLDFGSKASRLIIVESAAANAFDGVHVAVGDTVSFPTGELEPGICLFLGDSFVENTGVSGGREADGFATIAGEYLGFDNIWSSGLGGTGYVNDGATKYKLGDRLVADINRAKAIGTVTKVVVAMGVNDDGLSGIQAEAASCFDTIRSLLPAASVTIVGPWDIGAPAAPGAPYLAVKSAIQAAMAGRGGFHFIDPQGVSYTKSDGTHPNDAGHATLGGWLRDAERAAFGL